MTTRARTEDDIATLLAVPPSEFVAARNARVKELRADGDRDRANAVAHLRRPSVTTWAVNAAVRADGAAASKLVATVDALQTPGSIDVRATTRELDKALDTLVDEASSALTDIGTKPTADRRADIRAALRDAALADDPESFLAARLTDADAADPEDTLAAALRAGAHGAGRRPSPSPAPAPAAKAGPALDELKATLKAAKAAHKDADAALRDAERDVRRIQRELTDAERLADTRRTTLEQAEAAMEAARAELDEARTS